jgi:S1-C subfamily serine protease
VRDDRADLRCDRALLRFAAAEALLIDALERDLALLRFRLLVRLDRQHALVEISLDAVGIDVIAERDGVAVGALFASFGLGQTVTMGIISGTGRANMGITDYEDFIQTDAAINRAARSST